MTTTPQGYVEFRVDGTPHLVPERAVMLTFAILDALAPEVMELIERGRKPYLRVVRGDDHGGDAA